MVLALLGASVTLSAWYRRCRDWGATPRERSASLPGDELVDAPIYRTTKAITIDAPPSAVFPWLVQMGNGRGGLYSYDFLDRLFHFLDAPSAQEIHPEWQDLEPGGSIPLGAGKPFPVHAIERDRHLILAGDENGLRWTWGFILEPAGRGTRLLSRNLVQAPDGIRARLTIGAIDLPALIMTRQMLRNLKRRAERLAAQQGNGGHP